MDFHREVMLYADDTEKAGFPQIKKAQITIAGLGIFEIFINGKKVSEDLFCH